MNQITVSKGLISDHTRLVKSIITKEPQIFRPEAFDFFPVAGAGLEPTSI